MLTYVNTSKRTFLDYLKLQHFNSNILFFFAAFSLSQAFITFSIRCDFLLPPCQNVNSTKVGFLGCLPTALFSMFRKVADPSQTLYQYLINNELHKIWLLSHVCLLSCELLKIRNILFSALALSTRLGSS